MIDFKELIQQAVTTLFGNQNVELKGANVLPKDEKEMTDEKDLPQRDITSVSVTTPKGVFTSKLDESALRIYEWKINTAAAKINPDIGGVKARKNELIKILEQDENHSKKIGEGETE